MFGRLLKWLEWTLGLIGAGALVYWSFTTIESTRYQIHSERALEAAMAAPVVAQPPASRDWLGRLEIPRLNLSVIVLEGDDDAILKLGVGHVPGTVVPGQPGNAALAGHRDTFFRPLRGIQKGDEIRWTSPEYSRQYRVLSLSVVDPTDRTVLEPTDKDSLTLITCYPFNFIGPAPKRFIVRARLVSE
jgi:sortase A